jgi:hypothetical protein
MNWLSGLQIALRNEEARSIICLTSASILVCDAQLLKPSLLYLSGRFLGHEDPGVIDNALSCYSVIFSPTSYPVTCPVTSVTSCYLLDRGWPSQ